ncbi:hypothetical protein EV193_105193 [Herbihabitans rhizosphaerae]|uniref:Uncharacterized protein n=1 Tax=Herbihabitans rhizosphaerae TaxID=1872711 RepID=A0A4Q7KM68_9PSEU|nr:hypothetical protein [Herbihabitans rhizosphaerae]RZS37635.1 hypothetical protein EV193_105193 [Herbihabitans rhizosphaerae]
MSISVGPRFAADFARLITAERLDDLEAFLRPVELFDEPPLWTTFAQLSFLDDVPRPARDVLLIRAAVEHLTTVAALNGPDNDFFCMVSVPAEREPVKPCFFYTNPSNGRVLPHLRLTRQWSEFGALVSRAIDSPEFLVEEDPPGTPNRRVFVRESTALKWMHRFRAQTGTPVWSSYALERAFADTLFAPGDGVRDLLTALVDLWDTGDVELTETVRNLVKDIGALCFTKYKDAYQVSDFSWLSERLATSPRAATEFLAERVLLVR